MRTDCKMIICLFGLLTFGASAAIAGGPDFSAKADIETYYTSNLYHVSERREDQFDSQNGPQERFHDMSGPDDIVTRTGLDMEWQWQVAKKRDVGISFGGDYYFHARNAIADYLRVKGALAYDLTRRDEVKLTLEFIPDRFRKNLSLEDPVTSNKIFEPASYEQFSVCPRYLHDWNKDWSTGVEYEYLDRNYDNPFENRDQDRHTVAGLLGYGGLKRVDITLEAGMTKTDTPKAAEFGVEVDRSYDDRFVGLKIDFNLRQNWQAELKTKYRSRDYTTSEQADGARYDRRDDLWSVNAEVGKKITKKLSAAILAGWIQNDSDRQDPTVESDEVGYDEFIFGLTAEWKF